MDTATASLENKPLKQTARLLDDVSQVPGCDQLAAAKRRENVITFRGFGKCGPTTL